MADRRPSQPPLDSELRRALELALRAEVGPELRGGEKEAFEAFVHRRLQAASRSENLQLESLALVFACLGGRARSLGRLQRLVGQEARRAAAKLRLPGDAAQEVEQRLMRKLLVAEAGHHPRLEDYSGCAPLGGWLGVAVLRTALNLKAQLDRSPPTRDERPPSAATAKDPELALFQRRYRPEFLRALQAALEGLPPPDRELLRAHLGGEGLDALARRLDVHRATVARRLAQVRNAVLTETRRLMVSWLRLNRSEFESIARLVGPRIDASILRFLEGGPGPG